jgi:hypothetical protein
MYRFHDHVPNYDIPLKDDIPCLEYDFAVFCHMLKENINFPFPSYLEDFSKCVDYYRKRVEQLKPAAFPAGTRVYIIDNRLNFIFASIDSAGTTANFFSQYGKHGRHLEDYTFGDEFHTSHPLVTPMECNRNAFLQIVQTYDTLPIDELNMPSILIYQEDRLEKYRNISIFQACMLMEKFRDQNLVDWDLLVRQVGVDYTSF